MSENLIPYRVTQTTEILYESPRRAGRGIKKQKKNKFRRKIVQAMKWGASILVATTIKTLVENNLQEIIRDFVSR